MSLQPGPRDRTGAAPKARILLIDDSGFIRKLFTVVFHELGYEAHAAADGPEGLRMASECPYDVVVVDGLLPSMDGREVCRRLAQRQGFKPIIILYTASKQHRQERFTAFRDGIDECLTKDASGETLVNRVAELLAARDIERLKRSA